MQLTIMHEGLKLLENASEPRSVVRTAFHWKDDAWRDDYARIDDSNREELRQRGERRRRQQVEDKASGKSRAAMISET